jgi:formamidopyrimidine-DNA glycosylase
VPELPEVEITRRRIEPLLVGRKLARVRTTGASYLFVTSPRALQRALPGRSVSRLIRRGKYLVAHLDDGRRLLIHLGMTGQLFGDGATSLRLLSATARAALAPEEQAAFRPDRHTHLRLSFADAGPEVFLRDVRKFGKVKLLAPDEACDRIDPLGVDALEVDGAHLHAASRRRKVAVKSFLLDQRIVAGVGNIYADEGLFFAGVRPTRRAGRLSRATWDAVVAGVKRSMLRAIATGGSSISDFVAPDGSDGHYQDERRVYGRTGEPCPSCGAAIRRRIVGQRSSHYCPGCQS